MSSWLIPSAVERSAFRKLDRAAHHLTLLKETLDPWVNGDSYGVVHEFDADTGEHVANFTIHQPPPRGLEVLVGDFIQNLRNSLDHLVYGLTEHAVGYPFPATVVEKDLFFPIVDEYALTATKWERTVGALPPRVQTLIKEAQPDLGNQPTRHVLSLISQLANIDKHRTMHTVTSAFVIPDLIPRPVGRYGALAIDHVAWTVPGGGLGGTRQVAVGETVTVARYVVYDPTTQQRVHMHVEAHPCVSLDERSPVYGLNLLPLFDWLLEYTTNWIIAPILGTYT